MRRLTIVLSLISLLAATGCPPPPAEPEGIAVQKVAGGLALELRLPRRSFVRGEIIPVTIIARNLTEEDMLIKAESGALVYLTLWRHTSLAWEQLKRFPETAVMVASPWTLKAEGAYEYTMNLEVTPDWPTAEPLKISAHLNGRGELQPAGLIEVFHTRKDYELKVAH